jgi:molybdopterin-containing oxidoreductase family iron-sulfur binding subunit
MPPVSRPPSRREALALLAASAAAACGRPPPGEALPYVDPPAGLVPGVPQAYATSFLEDGLAEGLVVTSHEGRPTRIDGNPDHPASLGATRARAQAWVLGLYDADRARTLREGALPRAPGDLTRLLAGPLDGLHLLLEPSSSPLVGRLLDAVRARHPDVQVHTWAPRGPANVLDGARIAYGQPVWARPDLAAARVVVTVAADLLDDHPYALRNARDWASRRAPPTMSRVYAVETAVSPTGAAADVRIALPPSGLPAFVCALATHILGAGPWSAWRLPADADRIAARAASELLAAPGAVALAGGLDLPGWAHALLFAIGDAVGAHTVVTPSPWLAPPTGLGALVAALDAGAVDTLVILEGNPGYTAPALAHRLGAARQVVRLGLHDDETSALAQWHVPALHGLEAWGDARAADGTVSFQQPLIRPLWGGWTPAGLLARLGGLGGDDRTLLAETWRAAEPAGFETWWPTAIRLGLRTGSAFAPIAATVDRARVAAAVPAPPPPVGLELLVRPCPRLHDGRYANNPWLQELPDPITQIAWGNPAQLGPDTARTLGLSSPGRLEVDGISLPAVVVPGHAEGVVSVTRGYGRTSGGSFADGIGVDVNALAERGTAPLDVRALPGTPALACGQLGWDRDGRDVARRGTLAAYLHDPRSVAGPPPADTPLYALWPRPTHLTAPKQWAMAIDLNTCIGCGACAIACQAENNVPVVGPTDVAKGRRMHWLRVDRYVDTGGDYTFEPMLCQHCEQAPCEYVCPTNATVHSPDGLNEQVYNRCIGTRFCSNNCPWKVRRFNWFDYDRRRTGLQQLQLNPQVTARQRGVMEKCTFCVQRIRTRGIAERVGTDTPEPTLETACQQACPTRAITFGDLLAPDSAVAALHADPRAYAELGELGTRPRVRYLARLTNPGGP